MIGVVEAAGPVRLPTEVTEKRSGAVREWDGRIVCALVRKIGGFLFLEDGFAASLGIVKLSPCGGFKGSARGAPQRQEFDPVMHP